MGLIKFLVLLAAGFFVGVAAEVSLGRPMASLLAGRHRYTNLDILSSAGAYQLMGFVFGGALVGLALAFFAWRLPRGLVVLSLSVVAGAFCNAFLGWPAMPFRGGW